MCNRSWQEIRTDFDLDPSPAHFAAMMVSTHPRPVREAIAHYRDRLDRQPWCTVKNTLHAAEDALAFSASAYFGVAPEDVAFTDGTTMGLSLLYSGLHMQPGSEILTSAREFHGALHSLEARAKFGVTLRKIPLFRDPAAITDEEVLSNIGAAVGPRTRVLALTWVYSNSGVKLPIARIAELVEDINRSPDRADPMKRLLFCVDGVVGLGVEDATFDELRCDFFVAGCHKLAFGPRGTGIWCGKPDAWRLCDAVAPTSSRTIFPGRAHSPGGIHDYEHRWALKDAFDYLRRIGKRRIAQRTHQLADRFKAGLAAMGGRITLVTPRARTHSSALVCFDVAGHAPFSFVARLEGAGVLATVSPTDVDVDHATGEVRRTCGPKGDQECAVAHVRVAMAMFNLEEEVDRCLDAIDRLSR